MTRRTLAPEQRLRRLLLRARRRCLRVLVLGIGNEMLGDDAVGHLVAEELAPLSQERFLSSGVGVAVENAGFLIRRHRADVVVLIDATTGIGRLPWEFVPVSMLNSFCHSTHSVPLSLLVSAWRTDHPALDVQFIGIAPHSNEFGSGLSPAVAAAREEIVAIFRESLT